MQAALPAIATGGVLQGLSQYSLGQNQSRLATSAASQMEANARRAESAASDKKGIAQLKASETNRQTRKLISKQIATAAAQGASTSEKNIADLISKTAAEGTYRSLVDIYEGDITADQLLAEAYGQRQQAQATLMQGRSARRAANIGTFSSMLATGGNAADIYSRSFYGRGGNFAPNDPNRDVATDFSSSADYGDLYDY
jgi:hypothetical protein